MIHHAESGDGRSTSEDSSSSEDPPSSAASGSTVPAGSASADRGFRILRGFRDSAASPVKLGTFFSGLETPSIAAKQIGLVTQLGFAIELSKPLREHIVKVWQPQQIHGDVKAVNFLSLPAVDILVGGAPCQPFCPGGC